MIIDVNVNLSRWPFRRLPHDETPRLVSKLRQSNIAEAWTGSFDGLLHKDVAAVNARLADDCREFGEGLLIPFGSVNPMLPDWREDVRRCAEDHKMPGLRLHPNYHGYKLDAPEFAELLKLADEHQLIVQLALKMEDERTHHPLVQVPEVDTKPLADVLSGHPNLRLVILNGLRSLRGEALTRLAEAGSVYFEISMLEGVGGIEKLLKLVPLERVLFGSHFPFFYLESALLKLQESELGDYQTKAITSRNAQKLRNQP